MHNCRILFCKLIWALRILFIWSAEAQLEERREMPSKTKPAKAAKKSKAPKKVETVKTKPPAAKKTKATKVKAAKTPKVKTPKVKGKKLAKIPQSAVVETAQMISSEVVYTGPLFKILHDKLIEPGGRESERDVIRHNGSVVILAIDTSKSKKDPWLVIERQYRHAANQFLWELPAGKLDAGEEPLVGAKRELAEETGYAAKKWTPLVEYYASPGFLGESMMVFLAEGLVAGDAHPEDDEEIEFRLVKLSEVLKMIDKGAILDGKTLTSVLLYARRTGRKRKK
jgi:ADP-ribose pyrophosphatase